MAGRSLISDLVRDSKIETEFLDSCFQHVFYDTGASAKQRRMRREERWVRRNFVGRGAYGSVYLEQCVIGTSQKLRAVKEIKKSVVPGQELDYLRELEAVAKFSHQKYSHCFVQSQGWFELEDSIFISMEYLDAGDLQRYLQKPLPESETKQITLQVLEGLTYMHENGFVHRDLKPGNIMVVTRGPDWFVKITDFGISKRRQQDVTTLHTMQKGTLGFVAPEVLEIRPDNSYTFSVDIWSLGAVVYRIITNATVFQNVAELVKFNEGILNFPMHQLRKSQVSADAQDFIITLLKPDPKDRPPAASTAHHPWLRDDIKNSPAGSKEEIPAPVDETMSSIASRAWSVDSDTIHGLTNSSDKLVTDLSPNMSDLTITPDPEALEGNEITMKLLPIAARKSDGMKYESPSIEDVVEDSSPRPILPADSKFVLEPTNSPGSYQESRSSDLDISRAQSRTPSHQVSHQTNSSSSSKNDSGRITMPRRDANYSWVDKLNRANQTRKPITNLAPRDMEHSWSDEEDHVVVSSPLRSEITKHFLGPSDYRRKYEISSPEPKRRRRTAGRRNTSPNPFILSGSPENTKASGSNVLTSENLSKIPWYSGFRPSRRGIRSRAATADSRSLHSAGSIETQSSGEDVTKRARKFPLTSENLSRMARKPDIPDSGDEDYKMPRDTVAERDRSLDRVRERHHYRNHVNKSGCSRPYYDFSDEERVSFHDDAPEHPQPLITDHLTRILIVDDKGICLIVYPDLNSYYL